MTKPIAKITPIPRGADLTEDDLRQIVDDFYEVRNWAALSMKQDAEGVKEQCLGALRVRLGRQAQVGEITND